MVNEEFCVENGEFCVRNSEFRVRNSEFCGGNGELCVENGEFCVRNGEFGNSGSRVIKGVSEPLCPLYSGDKIMSQAVLLELYGD